MKLLRRIIIIWILAGVIIPLPDAMAQQKDSLLTKFERYRNKSIQEKIYVHTSQDFLLTGEILWFKIYCMDGSLHKPIDLSSVAYVELLDKGNAPALQTKVALRNGEGDGSLFLPVALNSGNYTLRAYTNWMKNSPADFYFQKTVTIINPFVKLMPEKASLQPKWDAQFFPEGGNLVNGLNSRVAFRVTDISGKGFDFKGSIINERNDTVVSFHPSKFGMGHFDFTPAAGNQYRAIINDHQGHRISFPLRQADENGYVLRLKDSADVIKILIQTKLPPTDSKPVLYLFVHTRQIMDLKEEGWLKNGATEFVIQKSNLSAGISHLTLFDSKRQPVCERLYFKYPEKELDIKVKGNPSFSVREKVNLEFTVAGQTSPHLSVSVFKDDSLQSASASDFYSYLWLSSDLKGSVESPGYYRDGENPEVRQSADLVMMTHGWRRFVWQDLLTKIPETKNVPELRGHLIRGKVVDEFGLPATGVGTFLSTPGKIVQIYPGVSNNKGEVKFETREFYGSNKVIAHAGKPGEHYRFELISPFSTEFSLTPTPDFQLSSEAARPLMARTVGMQIQNTFHEDAKDTYISDVVDSLSFFGKADETYFLDDYTRFPIMEEVMREYVKAVWVRKNKDGFYFMVFNPLNEALMREDPLILLDGVPLSDADQIMDFDPAKVKKLEVFRKKFYLGPITFAGILSYSTYSANPAEFLQSSDNMEINYEGLQMKREFYSPKYDSYRTHESRVPDRRNQLFWIPTVPTDKEGKLKIEFYTSDVEGTYRLVVEGMNNHAVGSTTTTFRVKK